MVVLFTNDRIDALTQKAKKLTLILIIVAVAAVGACVPLVIFANVNLLAMKISVCVIAVVAGWACIALFGGYIAPYRRRSAFENCVLSAAKVTLRGTIEVKQRIETVSRGVSCIVLKITANGKIFDAYWDSFFGEPPFENGKEYEICLADNIVYSYGEVEL